MRRFVRILFNALTVLSVILFIATLALWVRSYRVADMFFHSVSLVWVDEQGKCGRERSDFLGCNRGDLYVAKLTNGPFHFYDGDDVGLHKRTHLWTWEASPEFNPIQYYTGSGAPPDRQWRGLGVEYATAADIMYGQYVEIRISVVFLVVLTSVLPLARLRSLRTRRLRSKTGLCASCGYDLRATPDCCPECGRCPMR